MGYEPITYCTICGEPFDVYAAPDERICECCEYELRCLEEDRLKDDEPRRLPTDWTPNGKGML